MTESKNQQARAAATGETGESRYPGVRTQAYLDHGEESLVAMDNPDDSQLGAGRVQGKNPEQQQ